MNDQWQGFRKPNFGPPPAGYIAGIGRGATGFVTRSDLGPAKLEGAQRENDDADYVESKFDAWEGYSGALFTKKTMNQQDREAEQAYNIIEDRMDGKRRQQRERREKKLLAKVEELENKTLSDGFSDLKREMAKVSYDDWLNLPQSADSSLKKKKKEKYVPVPDAILMGFLNEGDTTNKEVSIDNMSELKEAKEILLKTQLDQASDKYKNQTAVDKTGYLTSLNGLKVNEESYIGDLKRARLVLKSATNTTPNNPEVWMCAARVEEMDGKLYEARAIINRGLEFCKTSEDLWIQAARLEKPELSKALLLKGLSFLPTSEKLWLTSARKEQDKEIKSKILKKGLETNSCSLVLWKELIELSDEKQAKELLKKAVECLPKQVDLWLALAKLEPYQLAKSVLNKARKNNPLEFKIWIAAAQLQQTQTNFSHPNQIVSKIQTILTKANQVLSKNGIIVKRDDWLEEAILCEKKGNLATCEAIVALTFTLSSQPDMENVIYQKCLELQEFKECAGTTRLLYEYGAKTLSSKMLMEKFIAYERLKGSQNDLRRALDLATKLFSTMEEFWLVSAENYLKNKEYDLALKQLDSGLSLLEDSQQLQLQKVDIYLQNKQLDKAEQLLQQLRSSMRIESWIKSIQHYYKLKNYKKAWELSEKAYKMETSQRVVELAFRIQKKLNGYKSARIIIEKAVERFDKSLSLWMKFAELEIENGYLAKARMILDKARIKIPKSQDLYVLSINLELKTNNHKAALFMLSKGLSELPKSGFLWAIAVDMQPRNTRLKKIAQAQNACSDNPEIYVAAAKIFWKQNKIEKAKKWFERAIILNPANGDSWAYFYCFLKQFEPESATVALDKFRANEVSEGHRWRVLLAKQEDHEHALSSEEMLEVIAKEIAGEMAKIQ